MRFFDRFKCINRHDSSSWRHWNLPMPPPYFARWGRRTLGPYWGLSISSLEFPTLRADRDTILVVGQARYGIEIELAPDPVEMPLGQVSTLRIEHRTVDGVRGWDSVAVYAGREGLGRQGIRHRWVTRGAIIS